MSLLVSQRAIEYPVPTARKRSSRRNGGSSFNQAFGVWNSKYVLEYEYSRAWRYYEYGLTEGSRRTVVHLVEGLEL